MQEVEIIMYIFGFKVTQFAIHRNVSTQHCKRLCFQVYAARAGHEPTTSSLLVRLSSKSL